MRDEGHAICEQDIKEREIKKGIVNDCAKRNQNGENGAQASHLRIKLCDTIKFVKANRARLLITDLLEYCGKLLLQKRDQQNLGRSL